MRNIRPWGYYQILEESSNHRIKRILVKTGCSMSLHYFSLSSEHWFVISGTGKAIIDGEEFMLEKGSSVDIKQKINHQLENTGDIDLIVAEIQTETSGGNYEE